MKTGRCLIANGIIISINHAIATRTHPKPSGCISGVMKIVVDNNTPAIRSRRYPHTVLNSKVRVSDNISIMCRSGFQCLIAWFNKVALCLRSTCRRTIRLHNPSCISFVTPSCLNAATRIVTLTGIQSTDIEAHRISSITLGCALCRPYPLKGRRFSCSGRVSARLQLRRIGILHVQAAQPNPKNHEECE